MIDLHIHTTASDGSMTPAEVVARAHQKNLRAIAITDHDTVAGVGAALAAGEQHTVEVLTGVEISAESMRGTMHILGYGFDHTDAGLARRLEVLQQARAERNPRMIAKLQQQGMRITMEDIARLAGDGLIGRPHFAQFMLQQGYVRDWREAFDRYLGKVGLAYVDKFRYAPSDAISMINDAGGIAVLAHPTTLDCPDTRELETLVRRLVDEGLRGIEVYYPEHTSEQSRVYCTLAERHGLVVTGGSDFHGDAIKGLAIGTGRGTLYVPDQVLTSLKHALRNGS